MIQCFFYQILVALLNSALIWSVNSTWFSRNVNINVGSHGLVAGCSGVVDWKKAAENQADQLTKSGHFTKREQISGLNFTPN